LRAHLLFLYLPLPDHKNFLHATAGDVVALRTLQPHNHTPPKHFEKFPSLNARTRAAAVQTPPAHKRRPHTR
jgi:hypothetical protein